MEDSWAKAEWYRRADEATTSGLSDSLLSGRSSNSSKAVVVVGAVAASSIHYSLSDDEDGKQLLLHDDVGEEDHPPSELLLVLKLCYCSMYVHYYCYVQCSSNVWRTWFVMCVCGVPIFTAWNTNFQGIWLCYVLNFEVFWIDSWSGLVAIKLFDTSKNLEILWTNPCCNDSKISHS